MKIRPFVVLLSVLMLGLGASAQESNEIAGLRAKAVKGNGIAQYNLGLAYAEGRGLAADPVEAFVWLSLARENGARGRALDNVVGSLDKASLDLALQRLAERKAALGVRPATPAPARPEPTVETPRAPGRPAVIETPASSPSVPSQDPAAALRAERDALATRLNALAGDLASLRSERDRLLKVSSDNEKNALAARDTSRAAEARVAELARHSATLKTDLEQARRELAAAVAAPKPAADTAALEAKARELQVALAELEAAKTFGRQVEDTLNKVNDDKARVAQAAAAELEAAKHFGQQVEATLNKVNDQKAALEQQLASINTENANARQQIVTLTAAKEAAIAEAARAQQEAATYAQARAAAEQALAAKPDAPAYPDVRGQLADVESRLAALAKSKDEAQAQIAALTATAGTRTQELAAVNAKLAGNETDLAAMNRDLAAAKAALAQANQALATKPAAPKYPDLSGRVQELEGRLADSDRALAAAKNAPPAYPNLTGRVGELEASLATASAEVARTRQEVATLTKANTEARNAAPKYPDLSGKVTDLEAQLAQAKQPVAPAYPDLRGKVGALETKLAALNSDLNAARAAQKDAMMQAAVAGQARSAAEQALAAKPAAPAYPDLSGRVSELETALTTARNAVPAYPNLAGRVKELEDRNAALTATVAGATRELADSRTQLAASAQKLEVGNAEQAALKAQFAQLQTEAPKYPDLRNRVTELESSLTAARNAAPAYPDLRTQVAALESQLAAKPVAPTYPNLSDRVKELEGALADSSRQLIAAQNAKPAAPAYADLSGRVTELEASLANAAQKTGASEQARAELAKQFDEYKSATAAAQRERTTLVANLKMLESDKAALRRQVESATTEASQLRTQVAGLKTQAAAVKPAAPAYPDLSSKVAELEASLAAKPVSPGYPDLSGRVNELETALAAARQAAPAYPNLADKVGELEAKVATLTGASQAAQAQVAILTTERDALSAETARAKQELAAMSQAQEEARAAQNELRDTVAKLAQEKAGLLAAQSAAPAYPDLSGQVLELETKLAASQQQSEAALQSATRISQQSATDLRTAQDQIEQLKSAVAAQPAAPSYPDLSGKVTELEAALAAKPAAPAYPDLSGRVIQLGDELTQLRADRERMQKMLADTGRQMRDATAAANRIRELESQVAALQGAPATNPAPAYPDLSSRVAELEGKLAAAATAPGNSGEAAQFRRERDELSTRVADLASEVAQLRSDRERLQKAIADTGRQLRDHSADASRIKELETQVAALSAQAGGVASERDAARSAQNELRDTIARLEQEKRQLATAQNTAPAYPDLSGRVRELEAQVAATPRDRAPSYPDMSGRVNELEAALAETRQQLATAQTAPAAAAPAGDTSELEKKLADTEDKLATALRGYSALQRERDAQVETAGKSAANLATERDFLTIQVAALTSQVEQLRTGAQSSADNNQAELARVNEALAALQRSSTQGTADLAAARALAQQLQGANSVLAGENYQLKTMLSRTTGTTATPVAAAATPPGVRTHTVAAGDSLSRLSQRYYGNANRWQEIYTANAEKLGPNGVLRVGTELRIP